MPVEKQAEIQNAQTISYSGDVLVQLRRNGSVVY